MQPSLESSFIIFPSLQKYSVCLFAVNPRSHPLSQETTNLPSVCKADVLTLWNHVPSPAILMFCWFYMLQYYFYLLFGIHHPWVHRIFIRLVNRYMYP